MVDLTKAHPTKEKKLQGITLTKAIPAFFSIQCLGGGGVVVVIETLITIKPFVFRMECLSTKAHMK